MSRKHVVTLELSTYDSKTAVALRKAVKRLGGSLDAPTGVRVTAQVVTGPTITDPIVLMERILE